MYKFDDRNIVFVAGIHGDEQMPVKALRENNTPFILGNPEAYERSLRFINFDLNSSFGTKDEGQELIRASEILKEIGENDLVVDFHSTTAVTSPFIIIVDEKMLPFATRIGLLNVVIMKYNIKHGRALINYRKGVSVEVGNHNSKESYNNTLQIVNNVRSGQKFPIKVFEVYGKITEPGKYINFQEHPGGFIPVLAGEAAYDFYGLKARRIS